LNKIMEHILEIALSAIIVVFLIIILFAGKMNGQNGILAALGNSRYNTLSDHVNQNTTTKVRDVMTTLPDDFNINYVDGTQKIAMVDNSGVWKNLYNFEDFITIRYEKSDYKYDKSSKKWLIRTGSGYVSQTGSDQKKFRVYVSAITDSNGKNVLLSDKVENLSDDIPEKILYDEDKDLIACFNPGTYNFTAKIQETNTKNVIEKTISIPFSE